MAVWPPEVNRLEPSRCAFSRPLPLLVSTAAGDGEFHPFGDWVIGELGDWENHQITRLSPNHQMNLTAS